MKIKIISCWNKYDWYNDNIGEVIEVVDGIKHYSCPDDSYQVYGKPLSHIKKTDCEKTDLPTTDSQIVEIRNLLRNYNISKINEDEFIIKIKQLLNE